MPPPRKTSPQENAALGDGEGGHAPRDSTQISPERVSMTQMVRLQDRFSQEELDRLYRDRFQQELAVLFSDIAGSTAYFEKHGDVLGRQMISRHNLLLFPIIEKHGGRIVKTIGDAIMAVFKDPKLAVGAAVQMQRALYDANSKATSPDQEILIRIGLNYGKALVNDKDGDVFGDMVNVAARVQSEAERYQILISEALRAKVEGFFKLRSAGVFKFKGKSNAFTLHEVFWDEAVQRQLADADAEVSAPFWGEALAPGGKPPGPAQGPGSNLKWLIAGAAGLLLVGAGGGVLLSRPGGVPPVPAENTAELSPPRAPSPSQPEAARPSAQPQPDPVARPPDEPSPPVGAVADPQPEVEERPSRRPTAAPAPRATRRPAPTEVPAAVVRGGTGTLKVRVQGGWATLTIDGVPHPLSIRTSWVEIPVSAGSHTVEFANKVLKKSATFTLDVRTDGVTRCGWDPNAPNRCLQ